MEQIRPSVTANAGCLSESLFFPSSPPLGPSNILMYAARALAHDPLFSEGDDTQTVYQQLAVAGDAEEGDDSSSVLHLPIDIPSISSILSPPDLSEDREVVASSEIVSPADPASEEFDSEFVQRDSNGEEIWTVVLQAADEAIPGFRFVRNAASFAMLQYQPKHFANYTSERLEPACLGQVELVQLKRFLQQRYGG